ncbi:DUF2490 domain-containing protein [uncultured Psychroserpens sp.]|uniref:DUF2490 domain-containing protein n=1 Tax=uncultured Psychroserpens sp. TaxID=255436 RepID=UPI002629110A|nr:DUF2490 domain-containing protein [uncultured Psychroserpens sp.]
MNILCTRILVLVAFLLSGQSLSAQAETQVFNENAFALRHNFNKSYSVNFEFSNRAFIYTDEHIVYRMRQIQIAHFSALKLDLKQSIALGLMYRNRGVFEDSSNEIRLTQQYNRKSIFKTLRLGHRFRSEQRFYDDFTAFRFRYRLAFDVPLQGLKLDVGETYLVFTNEALLTSTKIDKPELEYRVSPSIGMLISKNLNFEFGVELRLDKINIRTAESVFLNTSLELNL